LSTLAPALPRGQRVERLRRHAAGLLRYRELVRNFVIRDLKARYKNSFLGFLWSLVNPLLMMLVFTVVFTTLMPQNIERFPVFVLSGLLAWNWCAASVMGGVYSITGNAHLIKKVAFPRELLPLSIVLSNGVNFSLALIPLLLVAWAYGRPPSVYLLLLPLVMAVQLVFLTGLALFLGCLNVYFRDTEPIMDVLLLAWFFLTPVFYAVENLSAQYSRIIYILNPMASFISLYRLIFYYQAPTDLAFLLRMTAQALIVFAIGYLFFLWRAPDFGEEV
jgi:ABC-type polysaccharide/polyol phosphate export permease